MNKTCLVSGANGLVGTNLCKRLSKANNVIGLTTKKNLTLNNNTQYININFNHLNDFNSFPKRVDTVIHLAQSRYSKEFPCKTNDIYQTNVNSTIQLLQYALHSKASHFIYFSTGGLYANECSCENDELLSYNSCNNFYYTTKLISEVLCNSFNQYFTVQIVRPFFIYGKNQSREMLLPRLFDNIKNGKPINLNSKNGIRINPIHVDDVVNNVLHMINRPLSGVFNMAGPDILSIKKISEIIGNFLDIKPLFDFSDNPSKDFVGLTTKLSTKYNVPSCNFIDHVSDLS